MQTMSKSRLARVMAQKLRCDWGSGWCGAPARRFRFGVVPGETPVILDERCMCEAHAGFMVGASKRSQVPGGPVFAERLVAGAWEPA